MFYKQNKLHNSFKGLGKLSLPYKLARPEATPRFLGDVPEISAQRAWPGIKRALYNPVFRFSSLRQILEYKEDNMRTLIGIITSLLREVDIVTEHDRLVFCSLMFAIVDGCRYKFSFGNGMEPDVALLDDYGCLYLIDAKDSANESPSNRETAMRIREYLWAFFDRIISGVVLGGCVGICTNDFGAALRWQRWLNENSPYNKTFSVKTVSRDTFLIISELCDITSVLHEELLNSGLLH